MDTFYRFSLLCALLIASSCGQKTQKNVEESQGAPAIQFSSFTTPQETSPKYFKVSSLNMKGIPSLVLKDDFTNRNRERAEQLVLYLQRLHQQDQLPDVLVLQEIFDPEMLQVIRTHSPYPFHFTDHPGQISVNINIFPILGGNLRNGLKLEATGLLTLSKFPIQSSFMRFSRKNCAVDDCFTLKGGLISMVNIPGGRPITVINTHLQAQDHSFFDVRQAQSRELKQFYDFHRPHLHGGLAIIAGDFNFRLNTPGGDYQAFKQLFGFDDVGKLCSQENSCWLDSSKSKVTVESTFDRQWIINKPIGSQVRVTSAIWKDITYRMNNTAKLLTDHPILDVVYEIK